MYLLKHNSTILSEHTNETDAAAQKVRFISRGYAENELEIVLA
jgi:hypothetical protein